MRLPNFRTSLLFLLLIALDVSFRLLPHWPNCTSIAASVLFAGFLFESGVVAVAVPLLAMAISDSLIGTYDWRIMVSVYVALTFPVIFRAFLKEKPGTLRIGSFAILSSLFFFLLTNFAVWKFSPMYASSFDGLMKCYTSALPFLKYTLCGDVFWTAAFFGSYFAVKSIFKTSSNKIGDSLFGAARAV